MGQQKIVSPSFIGEYKLENLSICDDLIGFHKKDPLQLKKKGAVGNKSINGTNTIEEEVKKSTDMSLNAEEPFIAEFCPAYLKYLYELKNILNKYKEEYIYSDRVSKYSVTESINIQHYKPGEGFLKWHSERTGPSNRHLVFMTYLNDVPEGGTEFYYQNYTTEAVKGKTLIWPSDWTHTHKSQVSNTHEKYIITGWYSYIND